MRPTIKAAALAWLCGYSTLLWASTTFAQDVRAYDWMSLVFAAAAGLLGGAARTIFTLISPKALVGNVLVLLTKDLLVALLGGAGAYLFIQGYNSGAGALTIVSLPLIARDLRVLIIVVAGFSRGRWLGVLDRFTTDAIANARAKLRGGIPEEPPAAALPPDAGATP